MVIGEVCGLGSGRVGLSHGSPGRPVASDGVTAGNGAAGVQVKCARKVEGHSPELLQEPGDLESPRLRVG